MAKTVSALLSKLLYHVSHASTLQNASSHAWLLFMTTLSRGQQRTKSGRFVGQELDEHLESMKL
jgi:hypothetical protein